ncbi:MAG: amidase [Flavobacteriaceae bacterium]|nr:amidase [Flavobacteriaceae bacterium]|tara:strand:+ start:143262 stop:144902 length:1641 start_codon:yes stop_codon:yes gene_type:complete
MKRFLYFLVVILFISSCKERQEPVVFTKYNETAALEKQQEHPNRRMKFKLFQSKYLDMNEVFKPFEEDLAYFSEEDYNALKPMIIEQDIPTIQGHISKGHLNYEKLTLFYLYRIRKFESDSTKSLNAIIALNPNVVKEAKELDKKYETVNPNSLHGMPILLKDNINTNNMKTTAGAAVLKDNQTKEDAFIVKKLKENNALILGKLNLSEWAYFFCSGCPLGYSAVGGQTLNPYGRGEFETGGSSSGSGVATAANYAVATVGTETSGSITSPSSMNSVVGLKPTIGVFSRTGIVPISSTLDTPGPMTKSVVDNAIFMNALRGYDEADAASVNVKDDYFRDGFTKNLSDFKLGVLKSLMNDSIYKMNVELIKSKGATVVELEPENPNFQGFITLLNIDMKNDLPEYFKSQAGPSIDQTGVASVIEFNRKDTLMRAPYGQQLFEGIVKDETTQEELEAIKERLKFAGQQYMAGLKAEGLDAVLSINNYHSGVAAVAKYPTLTVPMGYKESGEPISLTFVGLPFSERKLLEVGYAFEKETKARKLPKNYE